MKYQKKIKFVLIIAVLLSSCKSTGDISHNTQRSQIEGDLVKLEAAIIPIEAGSKQGDIASVRRMITSMERDAVVDVDFSAKLTAWSGRLAIIEGRYSEAQRLYRQSSAASAGNIPSIILSIRLEGDPAKRMEIIEKELALIRQVTSAAGYGELQIERGRALFELSRFSESAGSFDAAFASGLQSVYRENYLALRNQAWELRNTSGVAAGTLGALSQETITWNDCITLVKNETQLLRFLTGGRDVSNTDLYTRLTERSFIPFTQDITINNWPANRPPINQSVTRSGAAWLIWRLYAENRADRSLLTRYSTRYATGANPRSPIADVPPLSPFFDSILGCVETEFLSLPDGRNFNPAQYIRAAEMLAILKRIDN